MANNQRLRRLGEKSVEPQNGKMMGWDVTVQRVRGGGRPVPKQVVGHAACRRYCLYNFCSFPLVGRIPQPQFDSLEPLFLILEECSCDPPCVMHDRRTAE